MGFRSDYRLSDAGEMTSRCFAPQPRLSPRCPGRTLDPHLIRLLALGSDESTGAGTRRECGVHVDDAWTTRFEANRNLCIRVLDLDLPLAVQRERTWPTMEVDSRAVIEETGVGYRNSAKKTGCNRDRRRFRRRSGVTDHDPGTRA